MSGSLPSEPVRDHLSSFGGCLVCVGALCFTLFLEGNWDISIRGGGKDLGLPITITTLI